MFELHNERCEAKKGDLLFVCVLVQREGGGGGGGGGREGDREREREKEKETERGRVCVSGLVCIQGDWSEVVWRWFGANMAGLRNIRNTNAFKFILQVFILSQKHILGVKKVV